MKNSLSIMQYKGVIMEGFTIKGLNLKSIPYKIPNHQTVIWGFLYKKLLMEKQLNIVINDRYGHYITTFLLLIDTDRRCVVMTIIVT
ncbi:MAG: hypothetical protein WBF33_23960 [Candidatus Nitrosopolaris sp.]